MKQRFTFLAVATLVGCFAMQAKVLSPQAAWQRANATSGDATVKTLTSVSNPDLIMTRDANGDPTLYVFSMGDNEGFCIVSADDVSVPVLGYSDSGSIDPQNLPENFKAWLDQYSDMIAYAAANGGKVISAPAVPSLKSIEPMLKTKWNQDAPYNDLCPLVSNQRTPTGCVATAMAQVINTYKYPAKGKGRNSYTWNGQTMSLDFSKITYDWNNMLNTYDNSATDAQKKAVAQLMYSCGIASNMDYGLNGSGTTGVMAGKGLITNFDYDKSLHYERRDYFPLPEWVSMIHAELSQGHPIYYDGTSATSGHAFVLDGYNATDGFFHVNWGWGGMSDGYFQITALDPDSQGIGGSTSGFCYGQGALLGLKKPVTGSKYSPRMYIGGDLCTSATTYSKNSTVTFLSGEKGEGIYSYSCGTLNFEIGLKLVSSTGATSYVWSNLGIQSLPPFNGYLTISFRGANFPTSGTYTVSMVCKSNDVIADAPAPLGYVRELKLECSSSQLKFTPIYVPAELSSTALEVKTPFYKGRTAVVTANVTNKGNEYYGQLYLCFFKSTVTSPTINDIIDMMEGPMVDIIKGQSEYVEFNDEVPSSLSAGNYKIGIFSEEGLLVSPLLSIEVKTPPSGTPVAYISNVTFPGSDGGNGTYSSPAKVYNSPVRINADVNCTRGYFEAGIRAWIFPEAGGTSIGNLTGTYIPVEAGKSSPATFTGDVPQLNVGTTYMILFANDETNSFFDQNQRFYIHIVGTQAGIEDITVENGECTVAPNPADDYTTVSASSALASVEIYSLTGAGMLTLKFDGMSNTEDIDVSTLSRGHYIVKVTTADGTVFNKRLMKK